MERFGIVLFKSTHVAVKAERVTQAAGICAELIPAPRHLSHDCGVALRFPRDQREQVASVLDQNGVEYDQIADLN